MDVWRPKKNEVTPRHLGTQERNMIHGHLGIQDKWDDTWTFGDPRKMR